MAAENPLSEPSIAENALRRAEQVIAGGGRIALPVGGLTGEEVKVMLGRAKADRWVRQCLNSNQPKLDAGRQSQQSQMTILLRLKASVRPWNTRRRPLKRKGSRR